MLVAITKRKEAAVAFRALQAQLHTGKPMVRKVGFQGGGTILKLWWHRHHKYWAYLGDGKKLGRYWCAYGTETEPPTASLGIVCEINPPHEGTDLRCAGVFVRDGDGHTYLGHTGKIGGGRKGIGKTGFMRSYEGYVSAVTWPDGRTRDIIILGRLGSRQLPAMVGRFVHKVQEYKDHAVGKVEVPELGVFYTPEFRGKRAPYAKESETESRVDHGFVVDALKEALEAAGLDDLVGNDVHRDLFVSARRGAATVLFEIMTDLLSTSIYTGLGQLMLHGAKQRRPPKRVLVIPGLPDGESKLALKRLGIALLPYHWESGTPRFAPAAIRAALR